MHAQAAWGRLGRYSSPWALGLFAVLALLPAVDRDPYHVQIITEALLWSLFVISWDILSGCTNELNFGHGFFIAMAGYLAAHLNIGLRLSPWVTIPAAAAGAAILGFVVGWLTLRTRGPYFSMVTIALGAILYKLTFIFWNVFRGEEGVSGVDPLSASPTRDYFVSLVFLAVSYLVLIAVVRSDIGLLLRAIRANENCALASGIHAARYKILAFTLSGLFAGVGGALYTHVHMQVTAELASGAVSTVIVLLAMIGSRGSITGPLVLSLGLTLLNEYLRVIEVYRIIVYTATLIVLVYVAPRGVQEAIVGLGHRVSRLAKRGVA